MFDAHALLAAAALVCLQELMQQASWNLCPQDIQYNADCYDDPDNKFASISGGLTKYMPDLPDGDWSLVLKKDIFQKVRTCHAFPSGSLNLLSSSNSC
jgi:hypothetical protein